MRNWQLWLTTKVLGAETDYMACGAHLHSFSPHRPQSPTSLPNFCKYYTTDYIWLQQLGPASAKRSWNADNARMLRIAGAREREGATSWSCITQGVSQLGKSPRWLLGNTELKGLSLLGELQISSSFSSCSLQRGAETWRKFSKTPQYFIIQEKPLVLCMSMFSASENLKARSYSTCPLHA